jgi:DNA (cytosine-5)-methyltransferase 1
MTERIGALAYGESPYDTYSTSWRRLDPNRPAPTVMDHHGGSFVHPHLPRALSLREIARLQGFPDSFDLRGGMTAVRRALANAVPPPLAKAIALALRPSIERLRSQAAADEPAVDQAVGEGR